MDDASEVSDARQAVAPAPAAAGNQTPYVAAVPAPGVPLLGWLNDPPARIAQSIHRVLTTNELLSPPEQQHMGTTSAQAQQAPYSPSSGGYPHPEQSLHLQLCCNNCLPPISCPPPPGKPFHFVTAQSQLTTLQAAFDAQQQELHALKNLVFGQAANAQIYAEPKNLATCVSAVEHAGREVRAVAKDVVATDGSMSKDVVAKDVVATDRSKDGDAGAVVLSAEQLEAEDGFPNVEAQRGSRSADSSLKDKMGPSDGPTGYDEDRVRPGTTSRGPGTTTTTSTSSLAAARDGENARARPLRTSGSADSGSGSASPGAPQHQSPTQHSTESASRGQQTAEPERGTGPATSTTTVGGIEPVDILDGSVQAAVQSFGFVKPELGWDDLSKKFVKKFQTCGMAKGTEKYVQNHTCEAMVERTLTESKRIFKKIPREICTSEPEMEKFLKGKHWSHIKSKQLNHCDPDNINSAKNGEWEFGPDNVKRKGNNTTPEELRKIRLKNIAEAEAMKFRHAGKAALMAAVLTAIVELAPKLLNDLICGKPGSEVLEELREKLGDTFVKCLKQASIAALTAYLQFSIPAARATVYGVLAVEILVGLIRWLRGDPDFDTVKFLITLGLSTAITVVSVAFPPLGYTLLIINAVQYFSDNVVRRWIDNQLKILDQYLGGVRELVNKCFPAVATILAGALIAFGSTAGTAVTVLGTFGAAAGTGTAISSLSGAAATNAALAWLGGGTIASGGGGMAVGSTLVANVATGGAVAAGIGIGWLVVVLVRHFTTVDDQLVVLAIRFGIPMGGFA